MSIRIALAALVLSGPAVAQAPAAPPCLDDAGFHELDFWLGDWVVRVGDKEVGRNRIERQLDGCAISEQWTSADGGRGHSLFYRHGGTWKQVWVTARALAPGGVKEKTLVEKAADGSLLFEGWVPLPGGGSYRDRTRLSPLAGGKVRQLIEVSRDGAEWRAVFDAVYSRE
jgi:hypothetical protein